jgi:hypothetical protein
VSILYRDFIDDEITQEDYEKYAPQTKSQLSFLDTRDSSSSSTAESDEDENRRAKCYGHSMITFMWQIIHIFK